MLAVPMQLDRRSPGGSPPMADNRKIPIIRLNGTPFERGRQHGRLFADGIVLAIDRNKSVRGAERWAEAKARAERSWPHLMASAEDIAQEICGIADGSGCPIMDIYLHSGFEFFLKPTPTGCSAIAASRPEGALVGQNWDAPDGADKDLVFFVHCREESPEIAVVASVGMLGWVGCNRHGLALVNNDLLLDRDEDGIPSQVIRRLILKQKDVPSAIDSLRSLRHMSGRCYLIGDATGQVIAVEVSPAAGFACVEASAICHTNHALIPLTQAFEDPVAQERIYPSTRQRLSIMKEWSDAFRTPADLVHLLRNRTGAPDSISKSLSAREPTQTAFSIVFDCAGKSVQLCRGRPSESDYVDIRPFGTMFDDIAFDCEAATDLMPS